MRFLNGLLLSLLLLASPAVARADTIASPDSLSITAGYAYTHVLEDTSGSITDLLILIHYTLAYDTIPVIPVDQTFLVQLLDTNGTTLIKTVTPVPFFDNGYGSGSAAVYLDAAEVTAAGLAYNDALSVRLIGNPSVFSSPPSVTNSSITWRSNTGFPGLLLSQDVISRSAVLQSLWGVPLIQSVASGGSRLTAAGESYWSLVIPNARAAMPQAFQDRLVGADYTSQVFTYDAQTELDNFWANTPFSGALGYWGPTVSAVFWLIVTAIALYFLFQFVPGAPGWVIPIFAFVIFSFATSIGMLSMIWPIMIGVAAVFIIGYKVFLQRSG